MSLNARSLSYLPGLHPDLVRFITTLHDESYIDFEIIHGLRTQEEENEYVAEGKSQTAHSRHIHGFAVDIAVLTLGEIDWGTPHYEIIGDVAKRVAAELNIPIVWGGSWKTLKDYGHYELDRNTYPDPTPTTT